MSAPDRIWVHGGQLVVSTDLATKLAGVEYVRADLAHPPELAALISAVETLIDAYRNRYRRPSTGGIRNGSPMYDEVATLNSALIASRAKEAQQP